MMSTREAASNLGLDLISLTLPADTTAATPAKPARTVDIDVAGSTELDETPEIGAQPGPNRFYSARELQRRGAEPGPFHNFPGSFDPDIFATAPVVTKDYFNKPKPGFSNDSLLYTLRGNVNGVDGTYEIAVRPSMSGDTHVVIHRFFKPDRIR